MKFMNFSNSKSPEVQLGCDLSGRCLDVTQAISTGLIPLPGACSLEDVLGVEGGLARLENSVAKLADEQDRAAELPMRDWSELRLRPPVRNPQKIIGIGLNYHDHADEVDLPKPEEPLLFAMFANAIIGPEEDILIPQMSDQIDFEAEMGVVIGRRGRHIPVGEALDYIAGYTIVNDVSARDLQFSDNQWIRGKTFDTFAPIGPCMATTTDLADGDGLAIALRLNGETMQQSNTRNLIFKVPELVSYVSRVLTLEPGDVIATGTPAGVGFTRTPPVFMQPGDVVEVDLEGVGTLRNRVAKE